MQASLEAGRWSMLLLVNIQGQSSLQGSALYQPPKHSSSRPASGSLSGLSQDFHLNTVIITIFRSFVLKLPQRFLTVQLAILHSRRFVFRILRLDRSTKQRYKLYYKHKAHRQAYNHLLPFGTSTRSPHLDSKASPCRVISIRVSTRSNSTIK
jgi:hypothetical protein